LSLGVQFDQDTPSSDPKSLAIDVNGGAMTVFFEFDASGTFQRITAGE
jgi:hypothetical protein